MTTTYSDQLNLQAEAAVSCDALKDVSARGNADLTRLSNSLSAAISNVNAIAATINDIIATFAATQAAYSSLTGLPGSAAGLVNLSDVIGFCQFQAGLLSTVGTTNGATFVKTLIRLNNDFHQLQAEVTALTAQATQITNDITSFQNVVTNASANFPNCTVSF